MFYKENSKLTIVCENNKIATELPGGDDDDDDDIPRIEEFKISLIFSKWEILIKNYSFCKWRNSYNPCDLLHLLQPFHKSHELHLH